MRVANDVQFAAQDIADHLKSDTFRDQSASSRIAFCFSELYSAIQPVRSRLAFIDANDSLCDQVLVRLEEDGWSLATALALIEELFHLTAVASRLAFREREGNAVSPAPMALSQSRRNANKRLVALEAFAGATTLSSRPWRHLVDPSSICNLQCRTCFHSNSKDFIHCDLASLPRAAIEEVMPFAESVNIAGTGEPLLSPSAADIIFQYAAIGADVDVTTNGTLIEKIAVIAPFVSRINISFDGASESVFEALRFGANFDRITSGIRELSKSHPEKINLNFVVNRVVIAHPAALTAA